ncbi:hypothetical protein [Nocardia asteroides]
MPHNKNDDQSPWPAGPGASDGWEAWLGESEPSDVADETTEQVPDNVVEYPAPTIASSAVTPEQLEGQIRPGVPSEIEGGTSRRRRPLLLAAMAVGGLSVVAALAAGMWVVSSGDQTTAVPTLVPATAAPAVASSAPAQPPNDPILGGAPSCPATRTAQLVRGNGRGSQTNGPEVILAFQYAYYVQRSGATARSLVAAEAGMEPAEVIDAGIATIPQGSEHCVSVTPQGDRFGVVITETRPGGEVRTYRQLVTVADRDGRTVITEIGRHQ